MKKLLVILAVITMVFCYTTIAAANTVYFDYMPDGEFTPETPNSDGVTQFSLEADIPFEQFKFGFEYLSGTEEYNDGSEDLDWDGYQVDFGYSFVTNDTSNVAVILGYNSKSFNTDADITGFVLGLDASVELSKNMLFDFGVAFGLNGEISQPGQPDVDTDILNYKLRFTYLFNENMGASLGYRCDSLDPDDDVKSDIKGFTLGFVYKF